MPCRAVPCRAPLSFEHWGTIQDKHCHGWHFSHTVLWHSTYRPIVYWQTDIGLNVKCSILLSDFKQNWMTSTNFNRFLQHKISRNKDILLNFQTYTKGRATLWRSWIWNLISTATTCLRFNLVFGSLSRLMPRTCVQWGQPVCSRLESLRWTIIALFSWWSQMVDCNGTSLVQNAEGECIYMCVCVCVCTHVYKYTQFSRYTGCKSNKTKGHSKGQIIPVPAIIAFGRQ